MRRWMASWICRSRSKRAVGNELAKPKSLQVDHALPNDDSFMAETSRLASRSPRRHIRRVPRRHARSGGKCIGARDRGAGQNVRPSGRRCGCPRPRPDRRRSSLFRPAPAGANRPARVRSGTAGNSSAMAFGSGFCRVARAKRRPTRILGFSRWWVFASLDPSHYCLLPWSTAPSPWCRRLSDCIMEWG